MRYSYSVEKYTGEIISELSPLVRYYDQTGWGYFDETYIFIYGFVNELAAFEAFKTYKP